MDAEKFQSCGLISRRAFTAGCLTSSVLFCLGGAAAALPSAKKSKSPMVSTLNGPVSSDSLGTTLMHEHVLWFTGPRLDNPGFTPIPDDLRSDTVDFATSLL